MNYVQLEWRRPKRDICPFTRLAANTAKQAEAEERNMQQKRTFQVEREPNLNTIGNTKTAPSDPKIH